MTKTAAEWISDLTKDPIHYEPDQSELALFDLVAANWDYIVARAQNLTVTPTAMDYARSLGMTESPAIRAFDWAATLAIKFVRGPQ